MPEAAIDYRQLAQALIAESGGGAAYKAVSSTPSTIYGHGQGGLFSNPALDRRVFSAMVLPRMGLADILPIHPSIYTNELYGIMTGVTASTGSDPAGPCDGFKEAGLAKLCEQTSYFGRQGRATRPMLVTRMGQLTNRGEHTDLQLLGNSPSIGSNAPTIMGANTANATLNTEIGKLLFELAVSWKRDFAQEFYTGNPANNNAGGGVKYYRGMDLLINTGYRDAETGVACSAADSIVESFGNLGIESNGVTFVRKMSSIMRRLRHIAAGTGLAPTKWAIAMRYSAFFEITEIWPCVYATYRCQQIGTGNHVEYDGERMNQMRVDMRGDLDNRTGQYLLIDDVKIPVVLDDGIAETQVAGSSFRSSIYFVPLTVLGGIDVTYMEYLDYDAPNGALASAQMMAPRDSFRTSDSGRFLWHTLPPTHYCVQMEAVTESRLILRTPHLAARLTGVQYTPAAHERDPFPDGPSFYVDGGQTNYNGYGPSWFTPTS